MERKLQNQCFHHSRNKHWTLRLPEHWKLYTTHLLWFSSIDLGKILGEILLVTKNLDGGMQQRGSFNGSLEWIFTDEMRRYVLMEIA